MILIGRPGRPRRATARAAILVAALAPSAHTQNAEPPPERDSTELGLSSDLTYDYSPWTGGESGDSTPIELENIYTPKDPTLDIPALDGPLDRFLDWTTRLEAETGLRLGFAYTAIFQQASGGPGRRYGASGDLDIMAAWTLLGRGTVDFGQLIVSGEYRHKIGPIPASELRNELGTLQFTTNGFNDRGWVVRDFYWIQRLFNDTVRFAVGRGDSGDFIGSHRMHNLNASFSNRAFSANSTTAFPGHGMTAGASIRPSDLFFVTFGASNAYGRTSINDMKYLDEGDFFTFAEAGFTPTIDGLGAGRYRLMLWHLDSRGRLGLPGDRGFSIIIDQDIGETFLVFARYGYADDGVTGIKSALDLGVGIRGLLGSPDNLTGIGFAYSEPRSGRDEKVLEGFHRWQLTRFTQFSLGAQAIIDPTNAPDSDAIGVFTARFRIAF